MKITIIDIEWDTDDGMEDELGKPELPDEVEFDMEWIGETDVTEENTSMIADWLSDKYGFCVYKFDYVTQ